MKKDLLRLCSVLFLASIFLITGSVNSGVVHAQSLYKVSEVPGGGGSSGSGGDSGNNSEIMYIVAGVAVAAIIGYVIYKRSTKEDTSSTSENESLNRVLTQRRKLYKNELHKYNDEMPVNFFFTAKKENTFLPERSYGVGVSFRF